MTLLQFIKLVSMCKGAMSIHLMQSFESGRCYDYVKCIVFTPILLSCLWHCTHSNSTNTSRKQKPNRNPHSFGDLNPLPIKHTYLVCTELHRKPTKKGRNPTCIPDKCVCMSDSALVCASVCLCVSVTLTVCVSVCMSVSLCRCVYLSSVLYCCVI